MSAARIEAPARLRDRIALRHRLGDLVSAVGGAELRADVERFLSWLAAERAVGRAVDVRELYRATSCALREARGLVATDALSGVALLLAVRAVRQRIQMLMRGPAQVVDLAAERARRRCVDGPTTGGAA
jgi:hypothetical protein